ncbi:SatD family protein [Clostridium rectalis]|uniref:SatD family protein n=1 Tax=Clostridium rectalis TaxID=2040295 RepID=UPI000F642D65|nr:SatD family protein [Clostridium rectalis]
MLYCTLICDIKSSRKLKNREELQYKIIDMLKKTNIEFKDTIISPFLITTGDEWQGLLKYPCDYKTILKFFKNSINNIEFYTGIGIGTVYVHNFELTVNQLDGPSFYRARDAIKYAKRNNLPLVILFDDWNNV